MESLKETVPVLDELNSYRYGQVVMVSVELGGITTAIVTRELHRPEEPTQAWEGSGVTVTRSDGATADVTVGGILAGEQAIGQRRCDYRVSTVPAPGQRCEKPAAGQWESDGAEWFCRVHMDVEYLRAHAEGEPDAADYTTHCSSRDA